MRGRARLQLAAAVKAGVEAALGSAPLPAAWFDALCDHPEEAAGAAEDANRDRAEAAWRARQR
jgi:hypothetical protein